MAWGFFAFGMELLRNLCLERNRKRPKPRVVRPVNLRNENTGTPCRSSGSVVEAFRKLGRVVYYFCSSSLQSRSKKPLRAPQGRAIHIPMVARGRRPR